MALDWDSPIQYVKKIGPRRAEGLIKEGIQTAGDLLLYAPFRYEDRTRFRRMADLVEGETVCVSGTVIASGSRSTARRRMKIFEMVLRDESGAVNAIFFNQPFLSKILQDGKRIILFGKAERDTYSASRRLQFRNPDFEPVEEEEDQSEHLGRIVPVYRKLGMLTGRQLRSVLYQAVLELHRCPELLPPELERKYGFPNRLQALRQIHFPQLEGLAPVERETAWAALSRGDSPSHRRMIFEEFFVLQTGLHYFASERRRREKTHRYRITDPIREVVRRTLPFKPTGAQKRVVREIVGDMTSAWPMNRLLQGDVGSGKTIVAVQAIIVAVENGLQAVLMAPTEILAEQHYRNLHSLLAHTGYQMALLKSGLPPAVRERLRERIAAGEIQVVVGTHSIIQKEVNFQRLALAIIDEQHRFGVMQRAELIRKGQEPDILVMTATPIPRTLALTVYGDLSLSVLDELPPGRLPPRTILLRGERDAEKGYAIIRSEMEKGHQAYVVFPLIEESEVSDLRDAMQGFQQLTGEIFPGVPAALLHGRLKDDEKNEVMDRFRRGLIKILVSTTVIEVGIDVPAATVMLIEHAERFGLSQLHQLRGRIGRGGDQSYCLLLAHRLKGEEAKRRLDVMCRTSDGFLIAEEDLLIRGPGEFAGTKQSGMLNFRFGSIIQHRDLMEQARQEAGEFIRRLAGSPARDELERLELLKTCWDRQYGLVQVG